MKNKRSVLILVIAVFAIIIFFAVYFLSSGRDLKDNQNDILFSEDKILIDNTETPVKLDNIKAGDEIFSPVAITGWARGFWYFEASFPVRLEDEEGNLLGSSLAMAQREWMTEEFVPFLVDLEFMVSTTTKAFLVLQKDNPSGLAEHDNEVAIPVTLKPIDSMMVKAFFPNELLDPEISCQRVFPLNRLVPKTPQVAQAALSELLKGLSEEEKAQGYFSSINEGVVINKLEVIGSTIFVDFDSKIEESVGGSCRVSSINSQIIETLRQFNNIEKVVISIAGRQEDILQP